MIVDSVKDPLSSGKGIYMKKSCLVLVLAGMVSLFSFNTVAMADYQMGSTGNEVRQIQLRLNHFGYRVRADGKFNWATYNAVKRFQARKHLEADGIVGQKTYRALMGRNMPGARSSTTSYRGAVHHSYGKNVHWGNGPLTASARGVTEEAKKYIGVPYVFGGSTPKGFDCSGFIQYVFNKRGISLPRTADAQYTAGPKISANALRPGDLVFFTTYDKGVSHSGLYLGDGYFISATSSRGVAVDSLNSGYWRDRYVGANRVL